MRVAAKDQRRELIARLKGQLATIRDKLKVAIVSVRAQFKARRIALAQEQREELARIREEHKDEAYQIRQYVKSKREQAQRLQANKRAEIARLREAATSDAQRRAAKRMGDDFSEAMDTAKNAIEAEHYDLVPAFRQFAKSNQARIMYREGLAKLRAKYPKGNFHPSDAGEWVAVKWMEGAAADAENLRRQSFESAEECYERAAIMTEQFDLSDPDQRREADQVWAACK